MDIILQTWGGLFYLANKILFGLAERKHGNKKRRLKLFGWIIYILGAPAWVIILSLNHNWIAASIEIGGVPSMLLGLVTVYQNNEQPNRFLDMVATWITYAFIIFGTSYSIFDYGGITSIFQILEIGIMIGFLLGSYLLAKNNAHGWLCFMLMNGCMGALMAIQGKPILASLQAVSFCFVVFGFLSARNAYKLN